MLALLFVTLHLSFDGSADPDRARPGHGGGGGVAWRQRPHDLSKGVLPNLTPAITAGAALAFARAHRSVGLPRSSSRTSHSSTEVASIFIFEQIEAGEYDGRLPVSVVLLTVFQ